MSARETQLDELPMLSEDTTCEQTDEALPTGRQNARLRLWGGLAATALLGFLGAAGVAAWRGPRPPTTGAKAKRVFLAEEPSSVTCLDIGGVKLERGKRTASMWDSCSAKWSEDCRQTGCCRDYGMKCYQKNEDWASCKASCKKGRDEKNETWTCKVLDPPKPRTPDACKAACKEQAHCKQAVYESDNGGNCFLSEERKTGIDWAGDAFNSSYCGSASEANDLKTMMDQVRDQLPITLPSLPLVECAWGGEDCSKTECCNDVSCDKNFENCYGYQCYKKSEYFSGCRLDEPPKDWDGKWVGGAREHRNIPRAGAQVRVQGTSLYCFAVVSWNAPPAKPFWAAERDLANNIKEHGLSIMQCDGHDFYDGIETPKAEWGSFSNIDAFQKIWKEVHKKGEYKKHDWTVKVDCDAIFIPHRLKDHLYKLRTPKGSRVYLENIDYRFKFMGALEVLTTQALEVFLEKSHTCIRGKHEGGEDFFMKGCMDALGIDHQTDFQLLRDRYSGEDDGSCTDGWAVAYHYRKKVISWNWCYNEVVCGTKAKSCPKGIPVEYVM